MSIPHVWAQEPVFPRYRHIDPVAKPLPELPKQPLRLLTSADFAPFEFQGSDGLVKGISVDLARAVCANLHLSCELVVRPFADLVPALERGDGDVIITPLRLTPQRIARLAVTRPYFVSSSEFIVKADSKMAGTDRRDLAGLRIGALRNSVQSEFLKHAYSRFTLQDYATEADMLKDLQAGIINAAFADTLHMAFWLASENAKGCCRVLGAPFLDFSTISRGAVFAAARDRSILADAFDASLDSLEAAGTTAEIFARYVPGRLW